MTKIKYNHANFVTMTTSSSGQENSSIAGQLNWPRGTITVLSSVGLGDLVVHNQVLLPRLLSLEGDLYLRKMFFQRFQIWIILTKLYGNGAAAMAQNLLQQNETLVQHFRAPETVDLTDWEGGVGDPYLREKIFQLADMGM